MAKLYWRVKRNGKWTWTPAVCKCTPIERCDIHYMCPEEEE